MAATGGKRAVEAPRSQLDALRAALAGEVVRRSSDLIAEGIGSTAIAEALRRGDIVRPLVGMYQLAGARTPRWKVEIAAAAARIPRAVVCLETAARLAALTGSRSLSSWLAVPNDLYRVSLEPLAYRLLCWSWEGAFEVGVTTQEVCGVEVRTTTPARTVVDLFRYVRHFRDDSLAVEAAERFRHSGGQVADLQEMARRTRAPTRTVANLQLVMKALDSRRSSRTRDVSR